MPRASWLDMDRRRPVSVTQATQATLWLDAHLATTRVRRAHSPAYARTARRAPVLHLTHASRLTTTSFHVTFVPRMRLNCFRRAPHAGPLTFAAPMATPTAFGAGDLPFWGPLAVVGDGILPDNHPKKYSAWDWTHEGLAEGCAYETIPSRGRFLSVCVCVRVCTRAWACVRVRQAATTLAMLARMRAAKNVLEIGAYTGYH